jgi:16S rRNA (adenine1518-N6/adenine1519-N6)-dimethyltransferase
MKWSQNFLIDNKIADRQIHYAKVTKNDTVLEIGPGQGILTRKLASLAKHVIAIEIDKQLCLALKHLENITLIHADVLSIDLTRLNYNKIVSNLPYEIASPLTFKLLDHKFDMAILMYQKEFARRFVATPGSKDYSRLTVASNLKATWTILEDVPPESFLPKPNVESSIVKALPLSTRYQIKNNKLLERILKTIFSHRRKNVCNALLCDAIISQDMSSKIPYCEKKADSLTKLEIINLSNKIGELHEK